MLESKITMHPSAKARTMHNIRRRTLKARVDAQSLACLVERAFLLRMIFFPNLSVGKSFEKVGVMYVDRSTGY